MSLSTETWQKRFLTFTSVAGLNLLPEKVSRFSGFEFWGSFSSHVKVNPVFSWKGQTPFQRISIFSAFYYTSNFLRILKILLHLKQLYHKTNQHKRSENLPFSRNLVTAYRKRRGQGGEMWTKDHQRSDANHIGSIWFRVRQRIALSWGSWGCRKVTLMSHPLKWTPQASLGAFTFAVWKNWTGGIHAPRKEEFREKVRRIGDFLPEQI